jgi:hypothetical protein
MVKPSTAYLSWCESRLLADIVSLACPPVTPSISPLQRIEDLAARLRAALASDRRLMVGAHHGVQLFRIETR